MQEPIKTVFMGTPEFAVPVLEALARFPGAMVAAVLTQSDKKTGRGQQMAYSPVKKRALELGLPVLQPLTLKSPDTVQQLSSLRPQAIVVAAYGKILPPEVLRIPLLGCLNVHPSLLPRYRGPSPVTAALIAGDRVTGVTIMLLDEGMDTGPILAQKEVPISDDDTGGTLAGKLATEGAGLLLETLRLWAAARITPRPQDSSAASYTQVVSKGDGRIDWSQAADEIWRRIRAFTPSPGCYTSWKDKLLKIHQAVVVREQEVVQPGKVVPLKGSARVGVRTGRDVLGLLQVQLEGKKPVAGADFVNGHPDFIGSVLC